MKTALTFVLVLAAACGGSKPAKPADKPMAPEKHEEMSPELTKFHDVLSPRWHADKGDKRMADTCAAIGDFQANADALGKAAPPTGADGTRWTAGTKELADAVAALDVTCKAKDTTAFEPAFKRVHEGFHTLMESGEHGKHGDEHGDHKM